MPLPEKISSGASTEALIRFKTPNVSFIQHFQNFHYPSFNVMVWHLLLSGVKHPGIQCDSCGQKEVTGIRWKCVSCPDYDLCTPCYMAAKHNLGHEFERLEKDNGLRCVCVLCVCAYVCVHMCVLEY